MMHAHARWLTGWVIATLLLILPMLAPHLAAARDPLAPVLDLPYPPLATIPGDLFEPEQSGSISAIVNEAREFGVPLAVHVTSMPAPVQRLIDSLPRHTPAPTGQQIVQRIAEIRLADEQLETAPGAADGLLLLVLIPDHDPAAAMAAFAWSKNTLPLNGLTPHSLENVLSGTIYPFFRTGSIADGIRTGVAMLSYDNLFAQPARLERTQQQRTLFTVTNTALFGLTLAASAGLVALAWRLGHRRPFPAASPVVSSWETGALMHGRVDSAITTAALLGLVRTSVIAVRSGHIRIEQRNLPATVDPFLAGIHALLSAEADADGLLSRSATRRVQDILTPARQRLEDDLAAKGLFNPRSRVETIWLILASAIVAAIALLSLVPAVVSMSRLGLLGILIAGVTITSVLVWTTRRSWTTPAGQAAVRSWRAHSDEDRRIVDDIVKQNVLLETTGGPDVPSAIRLTRKLRGLGAG